MKFALLALALFLTGCATIGRVDQMTVTGKPGQRVAESPLRGNVYLEGVTITGEAKTAEPGVFEQGLERSLRAVGLLAPDPKEARYGLAGTIQKVDKPYVGGNMTVTIWTDYVLRDRLSGTEVYKGTVAPPYTAKFLDSLVGMERLRLATEGAARENISSLIDDLLALKVGNVPVAHKDNSSKPPTSSEDKLRELKRLNDAGLISKEVYLDQQKAILNR
jgi:hypothetical protein